MIRGRGGVCWWKENCLGKSRNSWLRIQGLLRKRIDVHLAPDDSTGTKEEATGRLFGSEMEVLWPQSYKYTIHHTPTDIQIHCTCGSRTVTSPNPFLTPCYFLPCLGHIFQPCLINKTCSILESQLGCPVYPPSILLCQFLGCCWFCFLFFFPQKKLYDA